jgi:ABC-type polysaccharide/polyol phosphate export permease
VLGGAFAPRMESLLLSAALACVFLASGIWYFRRFERSFADVI